MKTIFRILTILVVASLVTGMFYAVFGGSSNTSQPVFDEQRLPPPDGEFERPDGEEFEGGVALPFEMIKTLVVVSIVTAVYTNSGKLFGKKKLQPAA